MFAIIRKRLDLEHPFMTTENILMAAVEEGGSRQVDTVEIVWPVYGVLSEAKVLYPAII